VVGLALVVAWLVVVAVVRGAVHRQRTGTPGIQFRDPPGSPQWWSRLISVLAVGLAFAAPLADIAGLLDPIAPLDASGIRIAGVVLVAAGTVLSVVSQQAMGDAWRGDVDPGATTTLVTVGPFRFVRNPTLAGTLLTGAGLALVTPNVLSLLMLGAMVVAVEIQVRLVEEPYLRATLGDAYLGYASRTGRFVPGLGRLRG
jgi:protein-S-isoprenylcysteine O-methyltransferase Ste14